jgi:hypothetical protein
LGISDKQQTLLLYGYKLKRIRITFIRDYNIEIKLAIGEK